MKERLACDLLLTGGTVVTINDGDEVFAPGAVAIRGSTIVAVIPVSDASDVSHIDAVATKDCTGALVMPALNDCHTHLFQVVARGLGDGLALPTWLSQFMIPLANRMSPDQAVTFARLGALQSALSGVGTVIDHHYGGGRDADTVVRVAGAIADVGLRGAVARVMTGPKSRGAELLGLPDASFTMSIGDEIAETMAAMDAVDLRRNVAIWPGPGNAASVSPDLLIASAELARTRNTRWHTHLSEERGQVEIFTTVNGSRPISWLEREGLLDSHATLAHCVHLDDEEIDQLGSSASTVVHNPVSNAYLGVGAMPMLRLLRSGATIAAGTDGSAVSTRDMFEVMKIAGLMQRAPGNVGHEITSRVLLAMATRGGAAAFGRPGGCLAVGNPADVTVLRLRATHVPVNDVGSSIVQFGTGGDVETVVVGGRVIVDNGRSTTVDEDAVVAAALEATTQLLNH